MRYLVITIFVLAVSFGTPLFSSAQSSGVCAGKTTGASCTVAGRPGTCDVSEDGVVGCYATPGGGGSQTTGPGIGNPTTRGPGITTGSGATLANPLGTKCNSTNTDCLGAFLGSILDFVIRIGTVFVILMLVFVGFKFVTAQGSDTKITEARGMLLWTVVGALILLGAKAIQVGITATVKALGG